MKFTNGFWRVRESFEPAFAVEFEDAHYTQDRLTVYATTKHIENRGDTLNSPLLTVTGYE